MPQASIVADTLRLWREAERVLETTAAGTPDHETARLLALELRQLYGELTAITEGQPPRPRATDATMQEAIETLQRVQLRLGGSGPDAAEA